jgi:hypothetical protein
MYTITPEQKMIIENEELYSDKTIPDYLTSPFGISLGMVSLPKDKTRFDPTVITIAKDLNPKFTNAKDLSFKEILSQKKKITLYFPRHPNFFINPKKERMEVGWESDGKEITMMEILQKSDSYELIPKLKNPESLSNLNSILQPDRAVLPIDRKKTIIYWNNTKAVAGRNPVRVFISTIKVRIKNIFMCFDNDSKIIKIRIIEFVGTSF